MKVNKSIAFMQVMLLPEEPEEDNNSDTPWSISPDLMLKLCEIFDQYMFPC